MYKQLDIYINDNTNICQKGVNKGNENNTEDGERVSGCWGSTQQQPPRQNRLGQSARVKESSAEPVLTITSTEQRSL